MSVRGWKIRARLASGIGILALLAGTALAQGSNFALPAQPLSESLKEVARETGQNILFTPQTVDGIIAPPLRGQMSGKDAVDLLLKGTHLEAEPDGAGGLIVRASAADHQEENKRAVVGPRPAPDASGQNAQPLQSPSVQAAARLAPQSITIAQPAGLGVEQVVVSASRISIAGYEAPTPVTMIGLDQLEWDSHFSIGDTIRSLPAVGISSSPVNGGGAANIVSAITGVDTVNLRNLGVTRTLVLFDGQRVVQSNITGGVDLSTIPATMVQRVDVVTGGASAAWGSDAVAGVVNLVLNKDFSGLKMNLEGGDSWKWDLPTWKAEISYGSDFDGNRGHVILSGQYTGSPDVIFSGQRSWYQAQALVNNQGANGQPEFIVASNVGLSQATTGGLIVGNPAGTAPGSADVLRGIQFVGAAGTPASFDFGNISGPLSNGGDAQHAESELNDLTIAYHTATLFGYGRYQFAPDMAASLQLNYGQSWTENNSVPAVRPGNLTIQAGNPFIPASIAATMAADGIPSFNLGSINTNNIAGFDHLSERELSQSLGVPANISTRQLARGVFTLEGTLNPDWSWNSYYQHGTVRVHLHVLNNVVNQNYANAVDAVTVTNANVGGSGLQVGSIACRSTLTDPADGCRPLNVFGDGVASQGAINPIDTHNDVEPITLNEDVAAASMQGQLPWSLPAGRISMAFGAEYRKEGGRTQADPGAVARLYSVGNFNNFAGQYHVEEGFAEINAPLLKDDLVENLDFNAAGRLTSYSTSGLVETWKLGLTSRVNDDLKLRTTWSLDIRAPDLAELFSSGTSTLNSAVDPRSGKNVSIYTFAEGNSALEPEIATTISGGVVLTPRWLDGLSFSADWYSIVIRQSIYTASANTVLAQCNGGNSFYCGQLVFGGDDGALSQIDTIPQNAASQTVSGLDFQGDYAMPFLKGMLNWHLVGNYTDEQTQTATGVTFDYAGSLGGDSIIEGVPKFKVNLSSTYVQGPWSGTVLGRLFGAAHINNAWGPLQVADNDVPAVAYLDLRASYKWNDNIQVYAAIDNATNVSPPIIPDTQASGQLSYYFAPIREDIYDAIGRAYRLGIRLNFPP